VPSQYDTPRRGRRFQTLPRTFAPVSAFGMALQSVRSYLGMSQAEIGRVAGVSHSYISRVESGDRRPSRELLRQITARTEVPPRLAAWLELRCGFAPATIDPLHILRLVMPADGEPAHHWIGWPDTVCADCGIADPVTVCLMTGCREMDWATGVCPLHPVPPCVVRDSIDTLARVFRAGMNDAPAAQEGEDHGGTTGTTNDAIRTGS
jgi:transcriptional regulator with XRE-family HTH domain